MNEEEAVAKLDAIKVENVNSKTLDPQLLSPGEAHSDADEILLAFVPEGVRQAYERVVDRAGGWWYS